MIPSPSLEIRDEELLAAQAIARTTGALDVALIDSYIANLSELRKVIAAGNLPPAICPELTNASPSAPHTVLLETFAWLLGQMGYRINQIPDQNLIAFANLFEIELRPATKAQTMLRFIVATPSANEVIVPSGTRVTTADETVVFETTAALTIPANTTTGEVLAQNLATGNVLLAPFQLNKLLGGVGNISNATNMAAIDSGSEAESVDSALERMRQYQRRTERIVSAQDLEEAILFDALGGDGIVRVFPFVKDGQFGEYPTDTASRRAVGHTTVIVSTRNGEPIDALARLKINALLNQIVGNQFVYIVDPFFIEFNVEATVKFNSATPQGAALVAVEKNLREFYSAARENFGRPILRSEIIAVIEGTTGIDRIVVAPDAPILAQPLADLRLAVWQLPKLKMVILHTI